MGFKLKLEWQVDWDATGGAIITLTVDYHVPLGAIRVKGALPGSSISLPHGPSASAEAMPKFGKGLELDPRRWLELPLPTL